MKPRKHVSLSGVTIGRGEELMSVRGFDDFSEFISALIREEWERRHPPMVSPGAVKDISHKAEAVEAIHEKAKKMKQHPKASH